MSKTIPVTDQRETPEQFLTRNLRVAVKHLPEWDSKHMNYLEYRGLPSLSTVYMAGKTSSSSSTPGNRSQTTHQTQAKTAWNGQRG